MLKDFLIMYLSIGFIVVAYFIIFIQYEVILEMKKIVFRRDLEMPKQYKFPYTVTSYIALLIVYPWFLYIVIPMFIDGANIREESIDSYKKAVWDDISKRNNL